MSNPKSLIITCLAFLVIAGAVFGFLSSFLGTENLKNNLFSGKENNLDFVKDFDNFNFPSFYNKPLTLLNNTFSIQPLEAKAAQAIVGEDKKTVRYVNAYANTDVVQTKYDNKIKEDIILKQPGHPGEFSYQVNLSNYDFKKDQDGNFVFYQKGKSDSELGRVFTIPAPFMIDADSKKSLVADVDSTLTEDGKLVIKPSQSWLENSKYPIILDPTIEINIINIHSHPEQGENWTVNFTTQGNADLKIIPVDQATIDDDEFVSLSCGNRQTNPQILAGDVIYSANWSCAETATVVHYTKKAGNHTLRFEFGDQTAYAYNASSTIIFRASDPCNPAPVTGGTITYTDSSGANPRSSPAYAGGYTVHTFTSSGSMVIPNASNVSVLVVAGGGGGASDANYGGGGGGAGGVVYNSSLAVTAQTYTVTVGNGGASDTNGQNSVFSSVTATGGGKGGATGAAAGSGGSGGGAAYTGTIGTGTAGQGSNGGSGAYYGAGGGGGKGAAGSNGGSYTGGAGGIGASYSISGTAKYYGGGGGGAAYSTGGAGGNGGGGAGAASSGVGTNGTANTGGGGGGAIGTYGDQWSGYFNYAGGTGGSGIVIVRYLTSDFTCAAQTANIVFRATGITAPIGGTITYTDSNGANPRSSGPYTGGYTVHTFTTTGNSTFKVTKSGNVSVLVVAGGGGGSEYGQYIGGGGGGGGVVYNSSLAVTSQSYTVTVGSGGLAGNNGGNSVFSTITATGGGVGGRDGNTAGSGGSGGGAGYIGTIGTGTAGQGNNGGVGGGGNYLYGASGGGGGAGAVGVAGVNNGNSTSQSGAGGAGVSNSISGTATYYGGGGGGGANLGLAGAGGTGGGGAGGKGATATSGTANTGGGGGGAGGFYYHGGAGGSGIVIIRYLTSAFAADPDPVILK